MEIIKLENMESITTHTRGCAYRVAAGNVLVYIAPWAKDALGRRMLLCEVPAGAVIPSFVYRDRDYKQWRFVIVADGYAELAVMPDAVTSVLLKRFAARAKLAGYEVEGFENSLVERYQTELLKDTVLGVRTEIEHQELGGRIGGVIKDVFDGGGGHISSDDAAYRAVVYAGREMSVEVPEYDQIRNICRDLITVPRVANAAKMVCRDVVLDSNWYRSDCGILICKLDDALVTCVPKGRSYIMYDAATGASARVGKDIAQRIDPKAFSLSRTLPGGALKKKDLIRFGWKDVSRSDLVAITVLGLIGALIGILLPTLNQKVYDEYIALGIKSELVEICIVIGSFMIGNLFFSIVKSLCEFRLQSRVGYRLQDAAYYRVFRLPESFFHDYDSADLANRLMSISGTVNQFAGTVLVSSISTVFSVVYIFRMFKYSGKLTGISILMEVVLCLILVPLMMNEMKYERDSAENKGKASSKLYQYLNGIEKIRMAGVEDRAIYDYMIPYSEIQSKEIRKSKLATAASVLTGVSSTIFSMVLYYIFVKKNINISIGSFIGFNTALGSFTGALQQFVDKMLALYQLKPTYERFKPIFETASEDVTDAELPGEMTGAVTVSHVSFSYTEGKRLVLDDLSLDIRPGEYLGIVGASGCGKSTLLKLLLGFETPLSGQISYDGKDLAALNKQEFRKNLGVVLQNGKLIAGSIFENITITAPEATAADVQQVIEAVGLKEDIANMPMGIHTVLSENSGTISGGQQQRILIARAIIRQPSILIFDEATSALDNLTQAAVCDSLDKMKVTRIVVAHRLSTIRNCDRIIVMKDGRIVEQGDFDSLMALNGLFYQLASRQIAE